MKKTEERPEVVLETIADHNRISGYDMQNDIIVLDCRKLSRTVVSSFAGFGLINIRSVLHVYQYCGGSLFESAIA